MLVLQLVNSVIMVMFLVGMGSFIVLEANSFPNNQYLVVIVYTAVSALFYTVALILYLLTKGLSLRYLLYFLVPKNAALIGLFWGINYTFILISAPYVPNAVQVILAQSQTIIVYFVNKFLMQVHIEYYKNFIVFFVVFANMITVVEHSFSTNGSTALATALWCVVFILNALAGGLANVSSECVMEARKHDGYEKYFFQDKLIETKYDKFLYILGLNFGSNVWAVLFDLGCFWLAWISYGKNLIPFTFNYHIFKNIEFLFVVGMSVTSWVYTLWSYYFIYEESTLYMSIVGTCASLFQMVLFMFPFMGQYQSDPTQIDWISGIMLAFCSIFYALATDKRTYEDMKHSRIISWLFIHPSRVGIQ